MFNSARTALLLSLVALFAIGLAVENQPLFIKREFESPLKEFEWLTPHVAVARDDKFLYLTQDSGRTWEIQNPRMCGTAQCVTKVIKNNNFRNLVFFIGAKDKKSWFSRNIDEKEPNYESVQIEGKVISQFQFHPTDPNRALILVERSADEHYDLYVTSKCCTERPGDWRLVLEDVSYASFGSKDADNFDLYRIYGIRHYEPGLLEREKANQFFFSMDMDNTKTLQNVLPHGSEMFYINKYLFVATLSPSDTIGLQVSVDNGKSFRSAKMPFGHLKEQAYTILDGSEGAVFLNVFHSQFKGEMWGNVYLSDSTGSRYTISLTHNRRSGSSCDFHKIKSMEGVYIANIVGNFEDPDCQNCKGTLDCNAKCHFVSRITFDKGSKWNNLGSPYVDSLGQTISCESKLDNGRCPLHLHGFASIARSSIQTHHSAIGLIMATGNSGSYLTSTRTGAANTYFSRDAGVSWEEVAKGPHVFDFINRGAIMLAAKTGQEVNYIKYSWNEGKEWIQTNFTDDISQSMNIIRIRASHNPTTKTVIIEALKEFKSVLLFIDFTPVVERECKGIDNPTDPMSDYEYFQPTTYDTSCFLGRKVKYVRRKRLSKCHNPQISINPLVIAHCPCEQSDFECDYGFERKLGDRGQIYCVLAKGFDGDALKAPPKVCRGLYNETQGFRKVAGNSCFNGINWDPIVRQCPQGFGIIGFFLLMIFGCVLCCLLGGAMYRGNFFRFLFGGKPNVSILNPISYAPVGNIDQDNSIGIEEDEEEGPEEINEDKLKRKQNEISNKEPVVQQSQAAVSTTSNVVGDMKRVSLDGPIKVEVEEIKLAAPPASVDKKAEDFKVVTVVRKNV